MSMRTERIQFDPSVFSVGTGDASHRILDWRYRRSFFSFVTTRSKDVVERLSNTEFTRIDPFDVDCQEEVEN